MLKAKAALEVHLKFLESEEYPDTASEMRKHIEALSMEQALPTAEEVARLTKVEQQAHADRYAIHGALIWEGMWPLGIEKVKPSRHVQAILDRLANAEAGLRAQQPPPTPEDVARLEEQVRAAITGNVGADATWDAGTALSRLAAQAARVPGLEWELSRERGAEEGTTAGGWRGKVADADHLAAQAALDAEAAESERDAALEQWRVAEEARKVALSDASTLRERVAALEADQKALRVLHDEAQASADTAEARVEAIESAIVATLGGSAEGHPTSTINYLQRARALVTTEARVRELTAALESALVQWSGDRSLCTRCRTEQTQVPSPRVPHKHAKGCPLAVASHPAPTPPPGLLDLLGDFLATMAATPRNPYPDEDDPRAAGWADALDAVQEGANALTGALNAARASRAVPAPPGLLEAVGKLMPWVKALSRSAMEDDAMVSSVYPFAKMTVGDLRRIRAAYDAANGGRYAKTPEESSDAQGRAARDAAVSEDMEDAAKYRAAVDLLQAMKSPDGFSDALRKLPDGGAIPDVPFRQWAGIVTWFGDYLGLTLATPPPGPGGGERRPARTWGESCAGPDGDGSCSLAYPHPGKCDSGEAQGGPGGGEDWPLPPHDRCDLTCIIGRPNECAGPEMSGIRAATSTRARIAPTPTPEVPPLRSGPCGNTRQPDLYSCALPYAHKGACDFQPSTPDAPNPSTPSNGSPDASLSPAPESAPASNSPQTSTATEVVLDGLDFDGDRYRVVTTDGHAWVECHYDGGWHQHTSDNQGLVPAIARALAEAKREVAEARKATEDAMRESAHRYEVEIPEAALKAAESMRERAAKACDARARHCLAQASELPYGPVKAKWTLAADEAQLMARDIRALTLEEQSTGLT